MMARMFSTLKCLRPGKAVNNRNAPPKINAQVLGTNKLSLSLIWQSLQQSSVHTVQTSRLLEETQRHYFS